MDEKRDKFQVQQLLRANDIPEDISLTEFILKYDDRVYQRLSRQYKSLLSFYLKEDEKTKEEGNKEKAGFILTGVKDVDLQIILELEDKDLISLCEIDKQLNRYCEENSALWQRKIKKITPDIIEGISLEKPPEKYTWKQWYFYLKSVPKKIGLLRLLMKQKEKKKRGIASELCNLLVDLRDWMEASKSEGLIAVSIKAMKELESAGVEACGNALDLLGWR